MNQRRKTKPVHIGDVQVGGDAPVVVQSMTATDTGDAEATLRQIHELADIGCELVRIAVPDKEAAAAAAGVAVRKKTFVADDAVLTDLPLAHGAPSLPDTPVNARPTIGKSR